MPQDIKLVIMGSGGVGKSALTVMFINSKFLKKYDPTIEESYTKIVEIDGKSYHLEILDTAGTEQFTAMRDLYMRNGKGFALVYSIIAESTLFDLRIIRNHILKVKENDDPGPVPMVIVANKCDLADKRTVSVETGLALLNEFGIDRSHFYESSAKERTNVDEFFLDLVRQVVERYPPPKKKNCTIL